MWALTFEQLLWRSHRSHQARGRVEEASGAWREQKELGLKGGVRPGGNGAGRSKRKPDNSHRAPAGTGNGDSQ
jgi:hypothetical protein